MVIDGSSFEETNPPADQNDLLNRFDTIDHVLGDACEEAMHAGNPSFVKYVVEDSALQEYAMEHPRLVGLYDKADLEYRFIDDPANPGDMIGIAIISLRYRSDDPDSAPVQTIVMKRQHHSTDEHGPLYRVSGRTFMGLNSEDEQVVRAALSNPSPESVELMQSNIEEYGEFKDTPSAASDTIGQGITVAGLENIRQALDIIQRSDPDLMLRS